MNASMIVAAVVAASVVSACECAQAPATLEAAAGFPGYSAQQEGRYPEHSAPASHPGGCEAGHPHRC